MEHYGEILQKCSMIMKWQDTLKSWKCTMLSSNTIGVYMACIHALRSADGYNTESPEHLHINFAKDAYWASNKQDYTEQMALWLQ